jgi:hypothetical protein
MNRSYLLLIPIVVLLLYYGWQQASNRSHAGHGSKSKVVASAKAVAPQSTDKAPPALPTLSPRDEAIKRVEELTKRSDEANRRVKNFLTPEIKIQLIEAYFRKWHAEYQAFFSSWKVEPNLADQVIAVAKDRDLRLQENSLANLTGGVTNHKEYTKRKAAILEVTNLELTALLGADRTKALEVLEADIDERHRASVRNR